MSNKDKQIMFRYSLMNGRLDICNPSRTVPNKYDNIVSLKMTITDTVSFMRMFSSCIRDNVVIRDNKIVAVNYKVMSFNDYNLSISYNDGIDISITHIENNGEKLVGTISGQFDRKGKDIINSIWRDAKDIQKLLTC